MHKLNELKKRTEDEKLDGPFIFFWLPGSTAFHVNLQPIQDTSTKYREDFCIPISPHLYFTPELTFLYSQNNKQSPGSN